jgi:hypothetical protein
MEENCYLENEKGINCYLEKEKGRKLLFGKSTEGTTSAKPDRKKLLRIWGAQD